MVDATGGAGAATQNTMAEIADMLDIQDNTLDTGAITERDPVLGNAVETLEESFHERMAHLEYQMENAENPMEKLALEKELMHLEQEFEKFESLVENRLLEIENLPLMPGKAIELKQDRLLDAVENMVGDLRSTLMDSYAEFGSVGMPPDADVAVDGDNQVDDATCDELSGSHGTEETGGTGASGESGEASESAGTSDLPNPEELVDLLATDPQAFMDELSDLSPEDRNAMMMTVQTQLQQINQMFQMASQFSQAMHQTQTAVIQNMRV